MFEIEWDNIKVVEETPEESSLSRERIEQMNENMEALASLLVRAYSRAQAAASTKVEFEIKEAA